MPPASPDPACARSLSACGVPCRGGATARSARTGSGIQCRIPPRSTRPPRGSCVAASRRSRLSACPVAPPSAGSYRLHGRSWPAPRSRRPDTVGTRAGLCRRPATTLQRSPDSSVRCPAAPERWHGGPGDARRNRRGPDQSGRVAIRCPGSQGGSWMKQNRLNGRWQGDFSDFRRVGVYKGKAVDVRQVGRELSVRYVLEGSVRKAANRVRISGQLVDTTTGAHLWAEHFDGSLEDVFELQDRVTASVAGAIEPRLQRAEIERAKQKPTQDLGAYDYYLRGMASVHQMTRESIEAALGLFAKAFGRDPEYAAALAMAAWCTVLRKANGWIADYEREVTEGVQRARRAAAVGRDDVTALWSAGVVLAYVGGELETGAALID